MANSERAFRWITEILENHQICFKITGGLAARAYGVERPLADIDIEVSEKDIQRIAQWVEPYIVSGPTRHRDEWWDLELMTLQFEEQEIDIAAAEAKIYNSQLKKWEQAISDLSKFELLSVYRKKVPVETRSALIAYKIRLGRDVDLEDVRQLEIAV